MKTRRIILDENFSNGLAIALRKLGYDAVSVHETEWVGFKNGALGAELARSDFDVIITKDRNFADHSGILTKRPTLVLVVVDSIKLKQVKDIIFIQRFIKALTGEGLPEISGVPNIWPKSDYNNE
jgi:predicted nuclease of predicted toxin-antitoxin system